ncbi:MAG TPA: hypothetical protein PLW66_14405 [Saprospiraceae bacterium]|nr:hypothetical protein [Saprospiraceae bacterium]
MDAIEKEPVPEVGQQEYDKRDADYGPEVPVGTMGCTIVEAGLVHKSQVQEHGSPLQAGVEKQFLFYEIQDRKVKHNGCGGEQTVTNANIFHGKRQMIGAKVKTSGRMTPGRFKDRFKSFFSGAGAVFFHDSAGDQAEKLPARVPLKI